MHVSIHEVNYMNIVFAVIGLLAGCAYCYACHLLAVYREPDEVSGPMNMIHSAWATIPDLNIGISILLALAASIGYAIGLVSMANMISEASPSFAVLLKGCASVSSVGLFLCHSVWCVMIILYQKLEDKSNMDSILYELIESFRIPVSAIAVISLLCTSVVAACNIVFGYINVPIIFALGNPLITMAVGYGLCKFRPDKFRELPMIYMPGLGIALLGLEALLANIL